MAESDIGQEHKIGSSFDAPVDESERSLEKWMPRLVQILTDLVPKELKVQASAVARSVRPGLGQLSDVANK